MSPTITFAPPTPSALPSLGAVDVWGQLPHVQRNCYEVRSLAQLMKAMRWTKQPLIEGDWIHEYQSVCDLNERRLHDAGVLSAACANGPHKILLEIGTCGGHSTCLMARNAPQATVHTVNILPEEMAQGGESTTVALERDLIGIEYRKAGLKNVKQIYANTANWSPDFGPIDVAFIDGCHDTEFVYNDTKKVLKQCRPGSIILWHDFNPNLVAQLYWIRHVCRAIEQLYREKLIKGPVYHLQDSWTGLYVVE